MLRQHQVEFKNMLNTVYDFQLCQVVIICSGLTICTETEDDALLKQALEMSMHPTAADEDSVTGKQGTSVRDFSMMSEEEQFAYAMQMSLGESAGADG